jgi:hypothetical protein
VIDPRTSSDLCFVPETNHHSTITALCRIARGAAPLLLVLCVACDVEGPDDVDLRAAAWLDEIDAEVPGTAGSCDVTCMNGDVYSDADFELQALHRVDDDGNVVVAWFPSSTSDGGYCEEQGGVESIGPCLPSPPV